MFSKRIWSQLGASPGRKSRLVALRLCAESKFNVFAALEQESGHRFLLLKSNQPNIRPIGSLPSGRGFTVRFVVTAADPEGENCLQLELTEPGHADVFDVVANDVVKNVVLSADDKKAFGTFITRIIEWQSFLDQLPAAGLGEAVQLGLFAELWFLREFLLRETAPEKAVNAWAGPKALAKDFGFSGVAFEVKASAMKQHSRFRISSELQLDTRGVGRLILFGLLLEQLVADGFALPEIVEAIRTDLHPHPEAALRFSELLLQAGYVDADAPHYTTRYAIRSHHFFDVREDFPRITERDLRPGVGDVRYSISVSECERYVVTEEEARNIIRRTLL